MCPKYPNLLLVLEEFLLLQPFNEDCHRCKKKLQMKLDNIDDRIKIADMKERELLEEVKKWC